MKKRLDVVALLLLTFLLSLISCASCGKGNSVPSNPKVVSQTGSPDTLTATVSGQSFQSDYLWRLYSNQATLLVSSHPTYGMVNLRNPAECLRELADGRAYTVYKTDEGGWMYLFFDWDVQQKGGVLSHAVYIEKTLSQKDFSRVRKGTSLKDVTDVDPATAMWTDLLLRTDDPVYSIHLLKDGVLRIRYAEKEGNYTVEEIEFSSDFTLTHSLVDYDPETKIGTDKAIPFNYQILNEDYPQ